VCHLEMYMHTVLTVVMAMLTTEDTLTILGHVMPPTCQIVPGPRDTLIALVILGQYQEKADATSTAMAVPVLRGEMALLGF